MTVGGAPSREVVHHLLVKAQRRTLDEIGRAVGTPVLYLKSAWADPVLYGGAGVRLGTDIDILVRAQAFAPFGAALERLGFHRFRFQTPTEERYFTFKELTYVAPAGAVTVDLHRALSNPIWFDLEAAGCIDRAVAYDGAEGPVLSLCPEDQVLYAALHQASKVYQLGEHHLEDLRRLVARGAVRWDVVHHRAAEAGLRLALLLLLEALEARGVALPATASVPMGVRLRRAAIARWVSTAPRLALRRPRTRAREYLLLRPLLSDRATALPRFLVRYAAPLAVDRARALLRWRRRRA